MRSKVLGKSRNLVPVHIYLTPEQKLMLDKIADQKKTNMSVLIRGVLDMYLKYMDKAFMHPAEQDVMAKLQKIEDRLVKLNLKGLHATGQILYLLSMVWRMGTPTNRMSDEAYATLVDKSKSAAVTWLENRPAKKDENKSANAA